MASGLFSAGPLSKAAHILQRNGEDRGEMEGSPRPRSRATSTAIAPPEAGFASINDEIEHIKELIRLSGTESAGFAEDVFRRSLRLNPNHSRIYRELDSLKDRLSPVSSRRTSRRQSMALEVPLPPPGLENPPSQISSTHEKIVGMSSEIQDANEARDKAVAEVEELRRKNQITASQFENAKRQIEMSEEQHAATSTALADAKQQIEHLTQLLDQNSSSIVSARHEIDSLNASKEEIINALDQTRTDLANAITLQREATEALRVANGEADNLRAESGKTLEEYRTRILDLQDRHDLALKRIQEIELDGKQHRDASEVELTQLKGTSADLSDALTKAETQYQELQQEHYSLAATIREQSSEKDHYRSELSKRDQQLVDLESRLKVVQEDANTQIREVKAEAQTTLDSTRKQLNDLQEQHERTLKEKVQILEKAKDDANVISQRYEQHLVQRDRANLEAQRRIDAMEMQIENLQKAKADAETSSQNYEQELTKVREVATRENTELQRRAVDIERQCQTLSESRAEAERKAEKLEEDLERAQEERDRESKDFQVRVEHTERQLQDLLMVKEAVEVKAKQFEQELRQSIEARELESRQAQDRLGDLDRQWAQELSDHETRRVADLETQEARLRQAEEQHEIALRGRSEELRKTRDTAQHEIEELRQQNVQRLRESADLWKTKVVEKQKQIESTEQRYQQQHIEAQEAHNSTVEQYKMRIKQAQNALDALQRERDERAEDLLKKVNQTQADYEKRLAESRESLDASKQDYELQLGELRAALDQARYEHAQGTQTLQKALEEEHSRRLQEVGISENRVADRERTILSLQERLKVLDDKTQARELELRQLKVSFEEEARKHEVQVNEMRKSIDEEHARRLQEVGLSEHKLADREREIISLKKHVQALEETRTSHEKELSQIKGSLEQARSDHELQVNEFQKMFDEEHARRLEEVGQLDNTLADRERETACLKIEFDRRSNEVTLERDGLLHDLAQERRDHNKHVKELEELQHSFDLEHAQRLEEAGTLASRVADKEREIASLQNDFERQIRETESLREAELGTRTEEYAKRAEEYETRLKNAEVSYTAMLVAKDDAVTKANTGHAERVRELERKHEQEQSSKAEEVQQLRQQYENRFKEIENSYEARLTEKNGAVLLAQHEYEKELTALKQDHEAELAEMRKASQKAKQDYAERARELEESGRAALDQRTKDSEEAHQTALREHAQEAEKVRVALTRRIEELESSDKATFAKHQEDLERLKHDHQQSIEMSEARHAAILKQTQDEVDSVKESLLQQLKKEEDDHKATVAQLQQIVIDEGAAHKQQIEDLQSKHRKLLEATRFEADSAHQALEHKLLETEKRLDDSITQGNQSAERAIAEHRQHVQEMEQRLKVQTKDAEDNVASLEDAHREKLEGVSRDFERQIASVRQEADQARTSVLGQQMQNHVQEIKRLRSNLEEELVKAQADFENKISVMRGENEQTRASALDQQRQAHEQELQQLRAALKQESSSEIAELEERHATIVNETTRRSDARIAELEQDRNRRLAEHSIAAQSQLRQLNDDHCRQREIWERNTDTKIEGLLRSSAENLSRERQVYEAQIRELKESLTEQLEAARSKAQQEISDTSRSHEERIGLLQKSSDKRIAALEQKHKNEFDDQAKLHDSLIASKVAELQDIHKREVQEVQNSAENRLNESKQEYEKRIADMQREKDEASRRLEEAKQTQESKISEMEASHAQRIQQLERDRDQRLLEAQASSKTMFAAADERHSQALHEQRIAAESRAEDLKQYYERVLEESRNDHTTNTLKIEGKHRQALEAANNAAEMSLTQAKTQLESDLKNAKVISDTRLAAAEEAHLRALHEVQIDAEKSVKDSERIHQRDLDQVKREAEDKVKDITAANERAMSELEDRHDHAVSEAVRIAVENAHRAGEREVSRLNEDHANSMAIMQSEAKQQISKLQAQHAADLETAKRAADEQLFGRERSVREAVTADYETRLADSKQKHSLDLEAIKREHEEKLATNGQSVRDETLAEVEQRHSQQIKEVEESSRSSQAESLKQAREDGRAEAESLRDVEMTHARKEFTTALANKDGKISQLEAEIQDQGRRIEALIDRVTLAESTIHNPRQGSDSKSSDKRLDVARPHEEAISTKRATELSAAQRETNAAVQARLDAERRLAALSNDMSSLRKHLDEQSTTGTRANLEILSLKKHIGVLQSQLKDALAKQQQIEEERVRISSNRDSVESLRQQLNEALEKRHQAERARDALLNRSSSLRGHSASPYRSGTPNKYQVMEEPTITTDELSKLVDDNLTLRKMNKQLNSALDDLRSRFQQAQANIAQNDRSIPSRATPGSVRHQHTRAETPNRAFRSDMKMPASQASNDRAARPMSAQSNHSVALSKPIDFEERLKHAQAELSELGTVISQNEALFAMKINEHVRDLQAAKDLLTLEYKKKLDEVLQQKADLEKELSTKYKRELEEAKAELDTEHSKRLEGVVGESDVDPGSVRADLSVEHQRHLAETESRLRAEHELRVKEGKRRIAARHSQDFSSLIQEYDERIGKLFGESERIQNDLSIGPEQFEELTEEYDRQGSELERQKSLSASASPAFDRSASIGASPRTLGHSRDASSPIASLTLRRASVVSVSRGDEEDYDLYPESFGTPALSRSRPESRLKSRSGPHAGPRAGPVPAAFFRRQGSPAQAATPATTSPQPPNIMRQGSVKTSQPYVARRVNDRPNSRAEETTPSPQPTSIMRRGTGRTSEPYQPRRADDSGSPLETRERSVRVSRTRAARAAAEPVLVPESSPSKLARLTRPIFARKPSEGRGTRNVTFPYTIQTASSTATQRRMRATSSRTDGRSSSDRPQIRPRSRSRSRSRTRTGGRVYYLADDAPPLPTFNAYSGRTPINSPIDRHEQRGPEYETETELEPPLRSSTPVKSPPSRVTLPHLVQADPAIELSRKESLAERQSRAFHTYSPLGSNPIRKASRS